MKKTVIILAAIVFVSTALPSSILLTPPPIKAKASTIFSYGSDAEAMKQQLTTNIWNDVDYAKVGYALNLGEVQKEENVIKLMDMLAVDEHENVRIAAAFSLLKLGDYRGIDAVVNIANTDKNPRVKNACATLFEQRVKATTKIK